MDPKIDVKKETLIKHFGKEGMTSGVIVGQLKKENITMSESTVNNVFKTVARDRKWRYVKALGIKSPPVSYLLLCVYLWLQTLSLERSIVLHP